MIMRSPRKKVIKEKGSLSIEAAVTMPFFIFFCLILLYMLQAAAAFTRMNRAVCKTAETMAAYSNLYHNNGIEKVENTLLSGLSSVTDYSISGPLGDFLNLRTLTEAGDDLAYSVLAKKLYLYYYDNDEYYRGALSETYDINFFGSEFFNDGESINLRAACRIKPVVPIFFDMFPEISLKTSQRVKCWSYGRKNTVAVVEINIWKMDNLSRGKFLRNEFGANLDEFYPVVAICSGGNVTMIKSLDHTKKTYQNINEFKKTIKNMVATLDAFKGTDNEKYRDYTPVIREAEIKKKTLLLVVPGNRMTDEQLKAIVDIGKEALLKGIVIEVETYGMSS